MTYVSVGDVQSGYPCPKDGTVLELIDGKGAWCPTCHTVYVELATVPLPQPKEGTEDGARAD